MRGPGWVRSVRWGAVFLLSAAPVWLASELLWDYGGGSTLWPLKNAIELGSALLAAVAFSVVFVVVRKPDAPAKVSALVVLAAFTFILGGFKASNDYLDTVLPYLRTRE